MYTILWHILVHAAITKKMHIEKSFEFARTTTLYILLLTLGTPLFE